MPIFDTDDLNTIPSNNIRHVRLLYYYHIFKKN